MLYQLFFIVFCLTVTTYGENEGESCAGTCTDIWGCSSAILDIVSGQDLPPCTGPGNEHLVCCMDNGAPTEDAATVDSNQCEPVSAELTSPKTGQKAWDKCIEYQERFVYPCQKTAAGTARGNNCFNQFSISTRIVEGTDAEAGEFPHMVLLGYGEDIPTVKFLCGGTLLSDRFILTAGHCTFTKDYGSLTYAASGILQRSEVDESKVYKIKRIIPHPDYKLFAGYNDIALVETEKPIALNSRAFPACLDVGKESEHQKAIATGWGSTENYGDPAPTLQKVTLTKFSDDVCAENYEEDGFLVKGFNSTTQICYGDETTSKDTCTGDSGGPLQVQNKHVSCMYTVIGVTSFARACGFAGQPGVYTKVEPYVPWIESVVWP
uniref:Venom peptide n=1 Tax=Comana monomorpha TaxID=1555636 RepID=A0AAU6PAS4_9NEOP